METDETKTVPRPGGKGKRIEPPPSSSGDSDLDRLIASYVERLNAGGRVTREEILAPAKASFRGKVLG